MPRRSRREHVQIVLDDDVRLDGDLESARLDSVHEVPLGGGPTYRTAVRLVLTMWLDPATARVWHRHAVTAQEEAREAWARQQRLLPAGPTDPAGSSGDDR